MISTTQGMRMLSKAAIAAVAVMLLFTIVIPARAQAPFGLTSALSNPYPGFFQFAKPGRFDLIAFGGGFGSNKYGTVQEGFQGEQSLTRYVGIVGRASGYQLWEGEGFANPLSPGGSPKSRLNFGRFQGGLDFVITPTTHLYLLGGKDAGNSHATSIEGDFSTWLFVHSLHPISFMTSTVHNYENNVTSSSIDIRTVVGSTENFMFTAGGGGALYGGGFVSGVAGQGGPDLGVYYRPWRIGADVQAGYGSADQYGQIALYKQFSWLE
jgi:hypothetical protein